MVTRARPARCLLYFAPSSCFNFNLYSNFNSHSRCIFHTSISGIMTGESLVEQFRSLVRDVRQAENSQKPHHYDGHAIYHACTTFSQNKASYESALEYPQDPYVRDLLFHHWLSNSIPQTILDLTNGTNEIGRRPINEHHAAYNNTPAMTPTWKELPRDAAPSLKRKRAPSIPSASRPDAHHSDPVHSSAAEVPQSSPPSYLAKALCAHEVRALPTEWQHLIGDDGFISEQALKGPANIKCYHGCNQTFKTWRSAAEHMGWLPKSFQAAERHGILSPDAFTSSQQVCSKMPAIYECPFCRHLGVGRCPFDWSVNGSNYLHGQNPKANWRTAVWSEIIYHTLTGNLGLSCRCGLRYPSPYHIAAHILFGYCPGRPLTMLEWSLIAVKAPGQGTEKNFLATLLHTSSSSTFTYSSHFKVWKQGLVDQSILNSQRPQTDPVAIYIDRHSSSTARAKWADDTSDTIASHHRVFNSNETVLRMHVKDLASAYAMFHPNQPGLTKLVGLGPFSHPLHSKADRMRLRWALVMSCAAWDFLRSRPAPERVVIMAQDSWTLCPALLAGVCAVEDFRIHIGITLGDVKNALDEHEVQ